jgi:hypothetical protein
MRRIAASLVLLAGLLPVAGEAASGSGPGGYIWKDCREPGGPPCSITPVARSDNFTGLCSDEIFNPADGIGFQFPFYGTTYSDYAISANGTIYLSGAPVDDANNAALTGNEGAAFIAPLWDDWAMDNDDVLMLICPDPGCSNTGPLGPVESYQKGAGSDATGRFKEFRWFSTAHHRPTCTEDFGQQATFGVRLYENGNILAYYEDVDLSLPAVDNGASATIGVSRGFLGEFTQVSSDTAFIPFTPFTILFIPGCGALTCDSITAPPDACSDDTVMLTANTSGGVSPVTVGWDLDGDTTDDAFGNPLSTMLPPAASVITAHVTDACPSPGPATCSMSTIILVKAPPTPVVTPLGPTSFCATDGESVILSAGSIYAAYQWQRGGADIAGATSDTLLVTASGSYTVRVVDANGCDGLSQPVIVDADDCGLPCTPMLCDRIDVSPIEPCEGTPQRFELIYTGGDVVTVSWDLDADTVSDATGNPIARTLLAGTWQVTAHAEDSCGAPPPGTCDLVTSVVVNEPGWLLDEVSGVAAAPLLIPPGGSFLEVAEEPDAIVYNLYIDRIGSWYAPGIVTGRACAVSDAGPGARPGTVLIPIDWPNNFSWVLVTAANHCGEGPPGVNSLGSDPTRWPTWQACGPIP